MSKAEARSSQRQKRKNSINGGFGLEELRALGRELRRLREQRGWSLKRMSAESGISVAAIQKIEGGSANPSLLTVLRLAEVLGQPLDRLVATSRESIKVVTMVSGALPRAHGAVTDLTAALANRTMVSQLISIPPRDELDKLPITAPFFGYLLEGSLVVTFADGRVERLQTNDAIHVADRFPERLTNPLARRSLLLCLTDLRGHPRLSGRDSA